MRRDVGGMMILLAGLAFQSQAIRAQEPEKLPAEERRLNAATFREGLRKRGLTELLELHLHDFPPQGRAAELRMRRDLKLSESADAFLSPEARKAALEEANRLLAELIEQDSNSPDRFEWRFAYAHSLIYDESDPFITRLLYRGGNSEDRRELRARTAPALASLEVLKQELEKEYDRLDHLSVTEFNSLEREGHIERLDVLAPRADYLMLWCLYYDALAREENDLLRADRLGRILDLLERQPAILETPHEDSKVQVQGLVLAGMTRRLLDDHSKSREHFDRALAIVHRLSTEERSRVHWAIVLAHVESIRNDCEDARFESAAKGLARLREVEQAPGADAFGLLLVAALLERSVLQAQAQEATKQDESQKAAKFTTNAWRVPMRLIEQFPTRRDEVYAALTDLIPPDADPELLDPISRSALVAGWLARADDNQSQREQLLHKAITVGEQLVKAPPADADSLTSEVLFNVGIAKFRLGDRSGAAEAFRRVATGFANFSEGRRAAVLAVELAASAFNEAPAEQQSDLAIPYRAAMETLLNTYADSDEAKHWRFFYAQLLEQLGQHDHAATQYAMVGSGHEYIRDSMLGRLRALAARLRQFASTTEAPGGPPESLVREFQSTLQQFLETMSPRNAESVADDSTARLLAAATLLGAEVNILHGIDQPERALQQLDRFEETFGNQQDLLDRVWRVRLLAYDRLDRLTDAAAALPVFLTASPANAGATLQSLYDDLAEQIETLREKGSTRAQQKAQLALVVARELVAWAERQSDPALGMDRLRLGVQFAEASLAAESLSQARELFEKVLREIDGSTASPNQAFLQAKARIGLAETLYRAGDFAAALPLFNDLAMRLDNDHPFRWKSLLRDLQCRTALKAPPDEIIKVIHQHEYLHPEMGGPVLLAEFQRLLRENQRRIDRG